MPRPARHPGGDRPGLHRRVVPRLPVPAVRGAVPAGAADPRHRPEAGAPVALDARREVLGEGPEVEHAPALRQVIVPGVVAADGVGALRISVLVKKEPGAGAGGFEGEADDRVPAWLPLGEPPRLDDAAGGDEFDLP